MGLKTYSSFIYGHTITEDNQWLDFSDDFIQELGAQVDIGAYSFGDFADKVATAMNEVGSQEYTVAVDRVTRKVTISADNNFDLYVTTGSRNQISVFELLGFTEDKSGFNSYESDVGSGFIYEPQFILQQYIDFDHDIKASHSSVSESASGVVEVVSYGQVKKMTCEIVLATDIVPQGAIKENPNGILELLNFMNYIITKAPVEFIRDIEQPESYNKCILDSTQSDKQGTGFKLYEMYSRKLFGYYETKKLIFRQIV